MNVSGSFRLVSASDLGLPAGEAETVAGFLVAPAGARVALKVKSADLLGAVTALPAAIVIVVFVDGSPAVDDSMIRGMVESFGELGVHALIRPVAATEAVKRIRSGLVAESIDRATLNPLRAPEIVDRWALEQALEGVDGDSFVNPTQLVASSGGVVRVADG